MKGKEAAAAARKRAEEAHAESERLDRQLKATRSALERQVHDLEAQLRAARSDHMAEASRLAAEEVRRRLDEAEEERRTRGLSDDIVRHLLYRTDRFMMNACRYVSMTTGEPPLGALALVLAWKTDEDVAGLPYIDQLMELGIPRDGWVASRIKGLSPGWRRTSVWRDLAVSLDHAEEREHPKIHPEYRASWYSQNVEYPELAVSP